MGESLQLDGLLVAARFLMFHRIRHFLCPAAALRWLSYLLVRQNMALPSNMQHTSQQMLIKENTSPPWVSWDSCKFWTIVSNAWLLFPWIVQEKSEAWRHDMTSPFFWPVLFQDPGVCYGLTLIYKDVLLVTTGGRLPSTTMEMENQWFQLLWGMSYDVIFFCLGYPAHNHISWLRWSMFFFIGYLEYGSGSEVV